MINEILQQNPALFYVMCGFFFLCVGSLLNVIIHRLPLMMSAEWTASCNEHLNIKAEPQEKVNLFFPRSFCPSCKHQIAAWQNLPLISYLILRGKCHYCNYPISLRYPFVELLTLVLSLFTCWYYQFDNHTIFALLFVWITVCMIFIDLDHQLLPDSLTLSLLWLGLIANTQGLFTTLPDAVLSAAGAYLFLWLIMNFFYLLTGKIGMGHGDFKLFAALGAWMGWTMLPLILLISSFAGAIVGSIYLKTHSKTKDTPIPFGPFLCFSGLIALFFGKAIVEWYLHKVMY